METLHSLNPQQQQAVMAGLGPVLVMAGPGSGKTRVLTHRIAYLIGSLGASPYHILAVTFTNKAAREMGDRVANLIGDYARGLTLGTFHAICARLLRREAEHLPFESNFVIFDDDDQHSIVKRAIADLNLDEKRYRPNSLHNAISNAKNELVLPDDFLVKNYRDEVTQRVYRRYQEMLLANNALDFDDLLLWTAYLLEQNPVVREKYARRYEHVLVDEFQDTNMAQYVLLKHLASFHGNLFVVGDIDQSIYRWRGADYRNLLRFEKDFPDSQVILLEQNYRSTQAILDVAMSVIDRHPYRTPKRLFTERGAGQKVTLHETYDDRHEAAYVVDTILNALAHRQAQPGDFAVMYRTNAQSRLLEEAFLNAGLRYKLVGAQRFYGRREVKDIIAFLRLAHNPHDEISLTRVINIPPRAIGDKTLLTLRTQAQKLGVSPGELLMQLSHATGEGASSLQGLRQALQPRALNALTGFGSLLTGWVALKESLPPLSLMDRILEGVDYRAYIDDGTEEGQDRWENVMELRRLAGDFQNPGLEDFLERVALVSDQDTLENGVNAPTLLTLHAAKGLEFSIVLIVGLNDGTLPHSRSFEDAEAMMEERRLFYVGITRAKDHLYLIYSQNRSAFGYAEPVLPSRFLNDIHPEFLDGDQARRGRRSAGTMQNGSSDATPSVPFRPERWGGIVEPEQAPAMRKSARPKAAQFRAGMRVQHSAFGEGMVLNSELQGDDEIVDIFFENLGLKRVMASLANLQVLT